MTQNSASHACIDVGWASTDFYRAVGKDQSRVLLRSDLLDHWMHRATGHSNCDFSVFYKSDLYLYHNATPEPVAHRLTPAVQGDCICRCRSHQTPGQCSSQPGSSRHLLRRPTEVAAMGAPPTNTANPAAVARAALPALPRSLLLLHALGADPPSLCCEERSCCARTSVLS